MATPAVTQWDANGNPMGAGGPAAAPTSWDANGNPMGAPPMGAPPMGALPMTAAAAPPRPQPAQDAILADLTNNSKGEGLYQMVGPGGATIAVPFSKVNSRGSSAIGAGYKFANHDETARYAKDYHAAPTIAWNQLLQGVEEVPGWRHWIDPTVINADVAAGGMKGVASTADGMRKLLGLEPKTPDLTSAMAERPNQNIQEGAGELGENAGEFVSGQELLGLLGKGSKGLASAGRVAKLLEESPALARVLKIGMNAVKNIPELGQALLGGAQTLVKTGGDTGAAAESALLTGGLGAATRGLAAGGAAIKTALQGPEAVAGPGAAEYAEQARAAVQPHLEETNAARAVPQQEVMVNQPGGAPAAPSGRMVATATGKPARAQIDINQVLSQVHDFTGAADHLTAINDEAYNAFDVASNGRFRILNGEVAAAQKAARRGVAGAEDLYKSKLGEMEKLIDQTGGEMTPEMKAAAKSGFRQSYMLRDFGDLWDRNLNGVPGASQASQAQRGIDGRGLMRDLQRAVKMYRRPAIEESLGQGRLENLEAIAGANQTAVQRVAFNRGVWNVVKAMHQGAVMGGVAGGLGGNFGAGAATGGAILGGAKSVGMVMDALTTNPKIAQNFLFALQSGATAERYGPFIATMIQKAVTDSSNEQQRATTGNEVQR